MRAAGYVPIESDQAGGDAIHRTPDNCENRALVSHKANLTIETRMELLFAEQTQPTSAGINTDMLVPIRNSVPSRSMAARNAFFVEECTVGSNPGPSD